MKAIRTAAALLMVAGATAAAAQTPSIVDGKLDERRVATTLEREFAALTRDAAAPTWIGYAVRGRERSGGDGCWNTRDGARTVTPIQLEGSADLFILYRVDDRAVGRIRIASPDCPLDLGGLTLHWLTNVTPTASLDWLTTFTSGTTPRRVSNGAVVAMALHGDPGVVDRLITIARHGPDRQVRGDVLFWLSQRAGERAVGTITEVLEGDPDTQVKRQAVFALSQLPRGDGVPRLIDVAKNNRNREVRQQAMFWLGQSQDPRALAFFEEVLRTK